MHVHILTMSSVVCKAVLLQVGGRRRLRGLQHNLQLYISTNSSPTIAANAADDSHGTALLVTDSVGHAPFSSSCPSFFRLQDATWTVPLWLEAPVHFSLQPAGPCALQAASISALAKLDCQTTHAACLSFAGHEVVPEQAAMSFRVTEAAVTGLQTGTA